MKTIYSFKKLLPKLASKPHYNIGENRLKILQQSIDSLSDAEAFVLQVMSILGDSLTMTDNKKHIYTVAKNIDNTGSINWSVINQTWERLQELKLITKNRSNRWNIDNFIADPVAKSSCNDSQIKQGIEL